ncbi:hypothetical protein Tco_1375347 [Tanacetum coccineum]
MSNSNTNLQTQSSNALHNAIMEAGSKDRPPMLAPGNYVQWKSRIKRYIDTKPNSELIHYCLQNPPYTYQWAEKTVPVAEGSSETTTERYMENYKNVSQDIQDQLNAEAEAIQIILAGIDNDIYSTVDACRMHVKCGKPLKGSQTATETEKSNIVTSSAPTYDPDKPDSAKVWDSLQLQGIWDVSRECQKPKELKMQLYHKERFGSTLYGNMAQIMRLLQFSLTIPGPIFDDSLTYTLAKQGDGDTISLLIHRIYVMIELKMTRVDETDLDQEHLKKFQAELDKYNDVNYASKVEMDCAKLNNLYDLFVPQREKSAEQHYFPKTSKMSHTSSNKEFSKESFRKQTTLLEKRMDESIPWDQKCKSSKELFKIKKSVDTIFDGVERCKQTIAKRTYFGNIDPFIQNTIEGNFGPQISRLNADLEKFHLCLNEEMVADLRYFNSLEHEVDTLKSQLETQKTQFLNEIDRLSREYYYADHMNAILGVYTDLDEVTNLQCDYVETWEKCEHLEKELSKSRTMSKSFEALQKHAINLELDLQQCKEKIKNDKSFKENQSNVFLKEREQYFEIQDLKAQLQDKGIAISELKKLIEKMKGKSVETKFEKSSVSRQPNAFKSQRQSILGKD